MTIKYLKTSFCSLLAAMTITACASATTQNGDDTAAQNGDGAAAQQSSKVPQSPVNDVDGNYINAHGGGILKYEDRYYWFGEHRPASRHDGPQLGVNCYSSDNLTDWKFEGLVLKAVDEVGHPIEKGCIIERPKVIYNEKTGKFVMWFHLELKGQGYGPAQRAVAVADSITGPYTLIDNGRANPGVYPMNMTEEQKDLKNIKDDEYEWWTPKWRKAVEDGMFVQRDLPKGQMSRDMTLFVDTDGRAYHIYSSEENLTLHIAELTDDYQGYTGRYIRIFPGGHNEAPAIFRKDDTYWMITSGCTGWKPNAARLLSASSIWGPWTQHPNPCRGDDAELTFHSQSTFVLPLGEGEYMFMADRWKPDSLMYSGHLWLPIQFDEEGKPYLEKRK